jgi:hypothetical protein
MSIMKIMLIMLKTKLTKLVLKNYFLLIFFFSRHLPEKKLYLWQIYENYIID